MGGGGVCFFFSSRRRHTRLVSDWNSDVCSSDLIWSAFGVGRDQLRMVAQAVLLGGHVRVGLEDNLYLKRGVPARNEQLVAKAADIIDTLGGAVMSPEETRDLLGLKQS